MRSDLRIAAAPDDATDFVSIVERVILGIVARHSPKTLVVIKIDNWFGSNWLGFSGKALGLLGVWSKPYDRPADGIRIPPFVPNRVVSQRRFSGPNSAEIDSGKPIHARVVSTVALLRKAAAVAPNTALFWYSGNSLTAGRGAVMAYTPVENSYWPWYAGWQQDGAWRLVETWDMKRQDLARLLEQGAQTVS